MPQVTDTSKAPYYSRFKSDKNYLRVLFQPSASVQVGEINECQEILANQIEKFGDAIFKSGTIIKGCNFSFFDYYPYAKISDVNTDGSTTNVNQYVGLYAKNTNNLTAYITDVVSGYEVLDPNLKTLYLNYVNSGDSKSDTQFTAGDVLTVYNPKNSLYDITINSGGSGFSNTDTVVITSAIAVNVSSGTFANGDYVINPTTGANAQIIGISTGVANSIILNIKPKTADLTNTTANSQKWSFNLFDVVTNSSNTVVASVNNIYGFGAKANIITNSTGTVFQTVPTNGGAGYTVLPNITIQSNNNTTGLSTLSLTAKNYLTKLIIPGVALAVGNGYAFGVGKGVVYQKGFFLEVAEQRVIISKYTQTPNSISVGFSTSESIIDANIDNTLFDNVTGQPNDMAPGANRLKLVPTLTVSDTTIARANSQFLTLVEWNDGKPYKQNKNAQYSAIGDAMATAVKDASGNFVLDPFQVTTTSPANSQMESQMYTAVIDPGVAYIDGYKITTLSNYRLDIPKGIDTKVSAAQRISLNYNTYIRVNQVGGLFQFSTGDVIQLYDTPKTFLSNTTLITSGNTAPVGNLVGTARIRSMTLENGVAGDPTASYRMYLFNISTINGYNFKSTRSIYYNGASFKGIADIITDLDPSTSNQIAKVYGVQDNALVFDSGLDSIKNSNNSNYIYRTVDQTVLSGNNGILTKSIASSPSEFFPYSGALSSSQMLDLYVVPIANNLVSYNQLTGTVSSNTTSNFVIGTGTTFITDLAAGDYITVSANTSTSVIKKVVSVTNNTFLTVDSATSFANTASALFRTFPKNVPIPFGTRSGLSANVNSNGNILTLNYNTTFAGTTGTTTALAINVQKTNISSTPKTSNRAQFVKIMTANNAGSIYGPWCLGVSDVFRLRNVFIGDATVNTNSVNITDEFYVDHNQNPNYLDLSNLVMNPKSALVLANTDVLLVQFSYFTSTGSGYNDTVSYLGTANSAQISVLDSLSLANLTSSAASFEVPQIYSTTGVHYDLLSCFDFRPAAANTITPGTNANTAPINPIYSLSFGNTADPTNTKKFPLPNSLFTTDVEYYLGRKDSIVLGPDSNIIALKGTPSADVKKRYGANIPQDAMMLQEIDVPPYPNITKNISQQQKAVLTTRVFNQVGLNDRFNRHLIYPLLDVASVSLNQPKVYTASDVGHLERRIKTLEYYQSLSILETSIANKIIPSSINGAVNRFKYGFFADDFSTSLYSERTNPQYSASIETANTSYSNILTDGNLPTLATNVLVPGKFLFGLKHHLSDLTFGYNDFAIVDQNNATEYVPNCAISPIITASTTSLTANAYFYEYRSGDTTTGWNGSYFRVLRDINLSTKVGGHCKFYYVCYADPYFTVYKNGQVVASTASARQITDVEVQLLMSDPYTRPFLTGSQNVYLGSPTALNYLQSYNNSGGWVWGGGVFEFDHDPSSGSTYTIEYKTPNGTGSWHHQTWQYLLIAPVDSKVGSGTVQDACGGVVNTVYSGTMNININTNQTYQNYDVARISCTGLKPLTSHYLFLSGSAESNVRQLGKKIGDPLTTDISGKIVLEYFYDRTKIISRSSSSDTQAITGVYSITFDSIQTDKVIEYATTNSVATLIELKTVGSSCSTQTNYI